MLKVLLLLCSSNDIAIILFYSVLVYIVLLYICLYTEVLVYQIVQFAVVFVINSAGNTGTHIGNIQAV